MELKQRLNGEITKIERVLIVPLWNWNKVFAIEARKGKMRINCTVVELKPIIVRFCVFICFVLIVPLWNWNIIAYYDIFKNYYVLIVPLWNWNLFCIFHLLRDLLRINCTVVELKHYQKRRVLPRHFVLIVPLWNWNIRYPGSVARTSTY